MIFRPIDFNFNISTDLLRLHLEPVGGEQFLVKRKTGEVTLYCPPDKLKTTPDVQYWLRQALRNQLRLQAKAIFPARLKAWSEQTGLKYNRLSIHSTSSRWGSYSGRGNLNLSLYLMLLDSRYVDYTMLHELCHSREMNHGPRFWALLNSLLDGKARQLSHEMSAQVRSWYSAGDPKALLIRNR